MVVENRETFKKSTSQGGPRVSLKKLGDLPALFPLKDTSYVGIWAKLPVMDHFRQQKGRLRRHIQMHSSLNWTPYNMTT